MKKKVPWKWGSECSEGGEGKKSIWTKTGGGSDNWLAKVVAQQRKWKKEKEMESMGQKMKKHKKPGGEKTGLKKVKRDPGEKQTGKRAHEQRTGREKGANHASKNLETKKKKKVPGNVMASRHQKKRLTCRRGWREGTSLKRKS